MIDNNMKDQLKSVFEKIEGSIQLVYTKSAHEKQNELIEMLTAVSDTSDKISTVASDTTTKQPHFFIKHNGHENGIQFTGIPGGHEFTSLILAILNSDGKGKLPDELIINKIKSLKGPIHLKTYISLSCDNCPEVVQALNIIAIHHLDMTHEMIDGGLVQEQVDELKIQGVPSVIKNKKLISAGKSNLIELLKKLEEEYGVIKDLKSEPVDLGAYDVVVIGAGPAGASSAIYSARKGLKTVIIAEQMGGQVQDTKGIENLISIPYIEGPQLSAQLASHIAEYDIQLLEHRRVLSVEPGSLKHLTLDSGEFLKTKTLIVATGAQWRELKVPGEKEYLGRGVAFCPHCDGPYYKGKDIAVIGGGNSGVEAAIDLAGIVKSITVVEYSESLKADDVLVKKLKSLKNVKLLTNAKTSQILGDGEKVNSLEYIDRSSEESKKINLDGVFVQIGLVPNSGFIKGLVKTNAYGEILIDDKCRTNIKGIYAAGDVTTVPFKQIVVAMGEGAKAALTAFEDQMFEGSEDEVSA